MNKHTDDVLMNAALRSLDPATATTLSVDEVARMETGFARIVATSADCPVHVPVTSFRRARRRRRVLATVGIAGIAGVGLPIMLLGGGTAFGSWTPTPERLSPGAASAAAATCRTALGQPDQGEQVAVAERRGDWTYVLLAGQGTESICLMPNRLVGRDSSASEDFFGSYNPDAGAPPVLAADDIDESTSMQGSTDEGWFIWAEGYVGREVTGITVHTSTGLDIEASVAGNRFAAWWPTEEPSSDHPTETWSYTVHFADGSSRDVE